MLLVKAPSGWPVAKLNVAFPEPPATTLLTPVRLRLPLLVAKVFIATRNPLALLIPIKLV